jgi:signal transduction histidine kinase
MTRISNSALSALTWLKARRLAEVWRDAADEPARVAHFRAAAIRLLLIEQWVLLAPIAVTAYCLGNSWLGLTVVGCVFHGLTSLSRHFTPTGLPTRILIANGLLLDVLLLIYALSGTGSWQMDGGHMWMFAVWSHALGLLCWRSLLASGALGVLHHLLLVYLFPLWVFPDEANAWRVVLHGGVVAMQISVLCVFVFLIRRMLVRSDELEQALEGSLDAVRDVSAAKSQFLAHMSHELRTPLNAIIGFSDVMKAQMFGTLPERYLDYADKIHASGTHLHDLINDVLDLSRVESGKHEIYEESVDPRVIVQSCYGMMSERARSAGLAMSLSLPERFPMLNADPRAMKQVILNLLSNAIKYTHAGGRITVALRLNRSGVVLSVSDTGVGISAAALGTIFDPFQRGDSMLAKKTQGTGLGLAISRKLMELHGGALRLNSQVGRGTVAVADFPASRLVFAAAGGQ